MNENTQIQRRPAPLSQETVMALSEASTRATGVYSAASSDSANIGAALEVAASIEELRALLDRPEIAARIVALQDTPIGFRTDRDPKVWNKKANDGKGGYNTPYPYPVARDCALEATLRGLQVVGNQFNIISARCYVTREGFEYLIRRRKEVTNFKHVVGIPRTLNGGAIFECEGSWENCGVPQSLKCSIPVKGDDYAGADQLIGKCTRKFLKRCYEMMTGNVTPEGDADELQGQLSEGSGTAQIEAPVRTRDPRAARATAEASTTDRETGAVTIEAKTEPPAQAEENVLQNRLAAFVVGDCGSNFDTFLKVMVETGNLDGADAAAGSFLDLSNAAAEKVLRSKNGLKRMLDLAKNGGGK